MSGNLAEQQLSIFEENNDRTLPVKPVRTEIDFGVSKRPALSATGVQSRIKRLVAEREIEATGSYVKSDGSDPGKQEHRP